MVCYINDKQVIYKMQAIEIVKKGGVSDELLCKKKTNGDRIRSMSNEELTDIILCPYDTYGKSTEIMPCVKDGIQELTPPEECKKCMMKWLQSEVEE